MTALTHQTRREATDNLLGCHPTAQEAKERKQNKQQLNSGSECLLGLSVSSDQIKRIASMKAQAMRSVDSRLNWLVLFQNFKQEQTDKLTKQN